MMMFRVDASAIVRAIATFASFMLIPLISRAQRRRVGTSALQLVGSSCRRESRGSNRRKRIGDGKFALVPGETDFFPLPEI
jgi:hypothetical protein